MDSSILVAVITASGSVLPAALTFYLTKKHQLKVERQKEKLNHYKVMLSSLSDLAVDGTDKKDANMRFSLASATANFRGDFRRSKQNGFLLSQE